jgi:hypothetical protein
MAMSSIFAYIDRRLPKVPLFRSATLRLELSTTCIEDVWLERRVHRRSTEK